MKHRISVSVEESTIKAVQDTLRTGKFRNKSHIIEFAVQQFLGGKNGR
ncbi:hypothetical protein HYU14_02670 [Candidatus Woesearchaeota archaeon]|nr:hypothetical protein [Candidatus Woesearchaeota archaeon]